jgi:hypothetical protein
MTDIWFVLAVVVIFIPITKWLATDEDGKWPG